MDTPKQANRAILVISVLVLIGGSFLLFYSRSHSRTTPLYQGKHFESWFYGGRTNFFAQETQTAAQKAFWDLTTNAFPFLLDTLNHNRGSGRIYLKTYRTMPTPVQALLPYPILSDDIRFRTWDLIWQMPLLTIDEVQALTQCLPRLQNPRIRSYGLFALHNNYRHSACFESMCTKLLVDQVAGIRLQAAIFLSEPTMSPRTPEPTVIPILMEALANTGTRASYSSLRFYRFQTMTPSVQAIPVPSVSIVPKFNEDQNLQSQIWSSLNSLKPYMSDEQKNRLRSLRSTLPVALRYSF